MDNTNNNPTNKKSVFYVVLAIIIIVLIILIAINNKSKTLNQPVPDQTEIELNDALSADKTTDIENSLNSIDVSDTTTKDLEEIDADLNSL